MRNPLFIANLAEALVRLGADVTVLYEWRVEGQSRSAGLFQHEWPLSSELAGVTRELDHTSWALSDAEQSCDVVHLNSALALPFWPDHHAGGMHVAPPV